MPLALTILLVGCGLLGAVVGLFYLRDRLESPRLARLAHSELMMRFTVIGVALIVIGVLLTLRQLLT